MVLVIVFVGMIAYPGIVTSYNSSAYARHRSATAATTEHDITLSDSFTARHQEANLDTFWAKSVVAPTWSQDPRAFSRSLPSSDPLHYLAPVVINATDLHPFQHYTNGALEDNSSAEQDPTNTPWSEADLFAFTTKIQERIQNIAVHYPPQEDDKSGRLQPAAPPRLVTLRDICLLDPAASSSPAEDKDSTVEQPQDTGRRCLVHSPLIYQDEDPAHVGSDIDLNGTLEQYRHKSSSNSLFGGLSLDRGLSPDHRSLSLVITFFLRGDLGVQAPAGPYDGSSATGKTSAGKTHHDPLDVRQIWRLIFKQLQIELQAERAKKAQARLLYHTPTTSENDNSLLSAEEGTEEQEEQDADNDITDVPSSGDSIPDPLSQFLVRALPVQETGQSGSRRLVSEVCLPAMQIQSIVLLLFLLFLCSSCCCLYCCCPSLLRFIEMGQISFREDNCFCAPNLQSHPLIYPHQLYPTSGTRPASYQHFGRILAAGNGLLCDVSLHLSLCRSCGFGQVQVWSRHCRCRHRLCFTPHVDRCLFGVWSNFDPDAMVREHP